MSGKRIVNLKNEYSSRLVKLYKAKKKDLKNCHWATDTAKELFDLKILDYNDFSQQKDCYDRDITEKKARDNIASSLKDHINPEWKGTISTTWIKRYCDYFKCSSDYLLGYINTPLHTAYDDVPLTFEAITALNTLRQQAEYDKACVQLMECFGIDHTPHDLVGLLNHIMVSQVFPELLGAIEAYINPEYNKPMFYLESQESISGRAEYHIPTTHNQIHKRPRYDDTGSIVKDNKGQAVYDNFLPLVKDESRPSDYRAIPINDAFLESVSLLQVQKCIDKIKADFKK